MEDPKIPNELWGTAALCAKALLLRLRAECLRLGIAVAEDP